MLLHQLCAFFFGPDGIDWVGQLLCLPEDAIIIINQGIQVQPLAPLHLPLITTLLPGELHTCEGDWEACQLLPHFLLPVVATEAAQEELHPSPSQLLQGYDVGWGHIILHPDGLVPVHSHPQGVISLGPPPHIGVG